jgi:D-alanyl-D-alanine carboxypeptidase (penicillin-binding protein 5/6)
MQAPAMSARAPHVLPLALVVLLLAAVAAIVPRSAAALETSAQQAILLDMSTDTVLFEKNADERMTPSSMSKIMTVYMVFDRIRQGRLSLDDMLPVSERAWRMGGSKMFVEVGTEVRVEDLIRGVVVQSGNDACIVLAEAISGSEEAFAEEMNRKAEELGMTGTHLVNASGWPDPNHYMTARDLAILAKRLIQDFPEFYTYFSETEFTYHGIKQGNRNPLLYRNAGADGLKTGHTEAGGYGLTASALRGDQRLILVVNGLPSANVRAEEAVQLLSWGYREFKQYTLLQAGEVVDTLPVWMGEATEVPLVLDRDLAVTLPRSSRDGLTVKVVGEAPVAAPIEQGQPMARLVVSAPGIDTIDVPLRAGEAVERLGPTGRLMSGIRHWLFGAIDSAIQ